MGVLDWKKLVAEANEEKYILKLFACGKIDPH